LFDPELRFLVLGVGTVTSVLLFIMYYALVNAGFDQEIVRTFVFASFGAYTLFLVFSMRSLKASILSYPFFGNRYLLAGTGTGFAMLALAIYLPTAQSIFGTVPLPLPWVGGVILVGLASMSGVELGKWLFRSHVLA